MTTAARGLRDLHQLHVEFGRLADELEAGPRQIKAREAFAEKKLAEIETERLGVTNLRKASDERTLQLKTNEGKILDLRTKLNTASSNKEFEIIKGQIDADTMANSVLEDEILELFERIESAQERLGAVEDEHESAVAEHQRITDEVAANEPGLKGQCQQLEESISDSESLLPGEVVEHYRRLVNAHGPGAMAEVDSGSCTACFVHLSPQLRVELATGQIVACNNCGRLLYPADQES
ncbi:MAG: C4-type zinc ribbon domain-containing protein [Planctomycetaceae bacterium]